MKNQQIAVIGGGLMGHGIALTFARANQYVTVFDPSAEMLATVPKRVSESLALLGVGEIGIARALKKIELCSSMGSAVQDAQVVFEAVPEKLELKQAIFAELEELAPEEALLASNTSVIQISKIMAGLKGRHRAMGTARCRPFSPAMILEI